MSYPVFPPSNGWSKLSHHGCAQMAYFKPARQPNVASLVAIHQFVSQLTGQMHCKPTASQVSVVSNWNLTPKFRKDPHDHLDVPTAVSIKCSSHTNRIKIKKKQLWYGPTTNSMFHPLTHWYFLFLAPSSKALRALGRHELGL